MTAEHWTRAVRDQLGLGRLLPLGGPRDGAWITEAAAEAVLRRAVADVRGVRLGALRLAVADPEESYEPAVPPPPSALPPGPLRVTADFATTASAPVPTVASRVRALLSTTATEHLGLTVTVVDLRVTALLGEDPEPSPAHPPEPPTATDDSPAARAVLAVPGVTALTGTLGGLGKAVHLEERQTATTLPHRHARVEIAVSAAHRTLDVAREVRETVTAALPDHPTVAVLVTTVG